MSADRSNHRFNLSAAALKYRELTLFFILAIAIGGVAAFFKLGQREDPDFAFRAMVVRTLWPGATAEQVDRQVTDRIEKILQETPSFKWTRSYSKPGESLIILELLDTAAPKDVPGIWYQVRKKVGDIRHTLPAEALGPFFNDEFGDVFGSIYAFTADGYTHSELRERVERVRQELLRLPNVAKIELIGVQEDKIYIELSTKKLASLGIDPAAIGQALQAQNAIVSPGSVETKESSVALRVTGQLDSVKAVSDLLLRVNGQNSAQTLRLGDIATVTRGYADPPISFMRSRGKPGIGLAVSMIASGDVLQLGDRPQADDGAAEVRPASGHRVRAGFRPTRRREGFGRRVHALAAGGRGDRAGGLVPVPRCAHRTGRCAHDSTGARSDFPCDALLFDRPAPHLHGRADHFARPAG